jgi:hypothetical protein
MSETKCPRYTELETKMDENLKKLSELTNLQLEIFGSKSYHSFMRLDKELELAVGEKERAIAL